MCWQKDVWSSRCSLWCDDGSLIDPPWAIRNYYLVIIGVSSHLASLAAMPGAWCVLCAYFYFDGSWNSSRGSRALCSSGGLLLPPR